MSTYSVLLFAALLVLCQGARADGCANVTIANAPDAEEARKNCRVISGDLILDTNLSESINLDGVEVVEGNIVHQGCASDLYACTIPAPFTISSSTLTTVNGSIDFFYVNGLAELVLPKLSVVHDALSLKRLNNVTHIDITALQYVGYVVLEARNLKTLLLDGLQGFTGRSGGGGVAIWDSGAAESLDGFFKNALEPVPNGASDSALRPSFYHIPNVRTLTVGWTKVDSLIAAGGANLTLVLGGPSTTSMEIERLELDEGVVGLERSPGLKTLSVGSFRMRENSVVTSLSVPFDQVTDFALHSVVSLRALELPPEAVGWGNLSLEIAGCGALNLSSEYTVESSGSRRQTWYWPQVDMRSVWISGNLSNDFFQSFIDYRTDRQSSNPPRVLGRFFVSDSSSKLDCGIFDTLRNATDVFPTGSNFSCYAETARSASPGLSSKVPQLWRLGFMAFWAFSLLL